MFNLITALGRNGLQDWVLQRVTAAILGIYTLWLVGYWLCMPLCNELSWHNLFTNNTMRIVTIIALLALIMHAWIGIWTIITDYIKSSVLSMFMKVFIFTALTFYVIWGVQILWG